MRCPLRLAAATIFSVSSGLAVADISSGTGFFIAPGGYAATCYHVVAGSNEIKVRDSEGNIYAASVLLTDVANDIAILKVDASNTPFLRLRRSSNVQKGESVFTIGYPNIDMQGTDAKVTEGIISSMAGIRGEPNSFQISVAVQPGNSGGPLFDSTGTVVGLVSSKLAQINALKRTGALPENVNYAVKSNYLLELTASNPVVSKKVMIESQKVAIEKLSSVVARVERATILVIASDSVRQSKPSESVGTPSVPKEPAPVPKIPKSVAAGTIPKFWKNLNDGTRVQVMRVNNRLYEVSISDLGNFSCDLELTGANWTGKCVYQRKGTPCVVTTQEVINSVTSERIEGESEGFEPPPVGSQCPVPSGRRRQFAMIPAD